MSLNKTLDRLFDEIRREAKRNPDFADRLDAVLQRHDSRRDVPDEVFEDVAQNNASPASGGGPERSEGEGGVRATKRRSAPPQSTSPTAPSQAAAHKAPALNPAGLYKKEGEAALRTALAKQELTALRALVAEHNLDPSGVTSSLTRDELADHIVAQAQRRADRDDKMFDY